MTPDFILKADAIARRALELMLEDMMAYCLDRNALQYRDMTYSLLAETTQMFHNGVNFYTSRAIEEHLKREPK